MKSWKVAIVGCGGIASVHAKVLSELEEVQMLAFCDIKIERAKNLCEQYSGTAFENFETMLDEMNLDAVHLCTPHHLHTPMAKRLEEKGIYVFTEKPPVISFAQWEEFSSIKKVPVGVCFQNRYNPEVEYIKQIIAENKIGKFLGARAFVTWSRGESYYKDSGWRGSLEMEGGGVLINQSIHTLDLLVYLLGKPSACEASLRNHHLKNIIEVEDTIEAYLDYEGAPVLFYASTAFCTDAPVFMELHFENLSIRYEHNLQMREKGGEYQVVNVKQKDQALGKSYWGNGHYRCIREFYQQLGEGNAAPIGIEEIRISTELMLELYEKARG